MKRTVRGLTVALLLGAAAIPARNYAMTPGFSSAFLDVAGGGTLVHAFRAPITVDFVISKFDKKITKAFGGIWKRSGNGTLSSEGVVLILRMADGSFSGRDLGPTNEYKRFTFAWHPATIAVVHTHPNTSDPKPCDKDIVVADKYQVPVFTITSRGMFVYDPRTRMVARVMDNLDWLKASNWTRMALRAK
jgi:hypothetical protein